MNKLNLNELPTSLIACLLTSEETKIKAASAAYLDAFSVIKSIHSELIARGININEFYPDERN